MTVEQTKRDKEEEGEEGSDAQENDRQTTKITRLSMIHCVRTLHLLSSESDGTKPVMQANVSTTSIDVSTLTSSSTWTSLATTTSIYNDHLFLQTVTCKAIAGIFTWTAIFITVYHVRNDEICSRSLSMLFFVCRFSYSFIIDLRRSIFIYVITMFHPNRNGSFVFYLLFLFIRLCPG
jgi:hypothetical protein